MTTPSVPVSPGDALRQVGQHIRDAARDLTAVAPRITDVHAVMVGLEDITAALTDLVDALTGATPALFGGNGHGALGDELLRDLRAARGCLTTAGLLVAPAVTDLRQLADGTLSAIPRPPCGGAHAGRRHHGRRRAPAEPGHHSHATRAGGLTMTRHPTGTRAGESLDRVATDSYAAIRHLEVRLDPTLALPPGGRAGR